MLYLEIRSRPMWDVVEWLSVDSACNLVLHEYTLVRYFCLWAKLLSGPVFWLNLEHNVAWSHFWYLRNAIWWSLLVLWDSAQPLLPSLWRLKQRWKGFRDYLWVSPPGAFWQMVNCSNVCMYVLNPSPDCNLQWIGVMTVIGNGVTDICFLGFTIKIGIYRMAWWGLLR